MTSKDRFNVISEVNHEKPIVFIFRTHLLPNSETFIREQALSLSRYEPFFVGWKRVRNGIGLPPEKVILLRNGIMLQAFLSPSAYDIELLQSFNPSLIHAHFGIDAVYALPLAQSLNIPLIVTFHGYDITLTDRNFIKGSGGSVFSRLYPLRRKSLFRNDIHFIAVSRFIFNKAISLGCPANNVSLHYIGVNTDIFLPSPTPLANRGRKILFVGRLVEKKGCSFLLNAVQLIRDQIPDLELRIIGDGPLRESLESAAKEHKLNCTFLGAQESNVVKDEMNNSRVFCVPSVVASNGDSEGFGIVFIEAQATGLPVVSFNSGGISEAVDHGKTGYLATERDAPELARYLITLLTNDDIWHKMSSSGIDRVQNNFCLKNQVIELEKEYDRIGQSNTKQL